MEFSICISGTEKKVGCEKTVRLEKKGTGYVVKVGDREYTTHDVTMSDGVLTFFIGHRTFRAIVSKNALGTQITLGGRDYFQEPDEEAEGRAGTAHHHGDGSVEAPMPGSIVAVNTKVGDTVAVGDSLVVLESMKMQNEITAPVAGKVKSVSCSPGDQVAFGAVLLEIKPA